MRRSIFVLSLLLLTAAVEGCTLSPQPIPPIDDPSPAPTPPSGDRKEGSDSPEPQTGAASSTDAGTDGDAGPPVVGVPAVILPTASADLNVVGAAP